MAPKLRVYNLARELNLDNAEIIRELQHMGVPVTSHSNTVDDRQAALLRKKFAVVEEAPKPAPEVVEAKTAKPAKAEPVVEHVEPAAPIEVKAEPKIVVKPEPPAPPATPVVPAAPVPIIVAEPKAPPVAAPPAPPAATVAPPSPAPPVAPRPPVVEQKAPPPPVQRS